MSDKAWVAAWGRGQDGGPSGFDLDDAEERCGRGCPVLFKGGLFLRTGGKAVKAGPAGARGRVAEVFGGGLAGEHVSAATRRICEAATASGATRATVFFNNVTAVSERLAGESAEDWGKRLSSLWMVAMERGCEERRLEDEASGKADARRRETAKRVAMASAAMAEARAGMESLRADFGEKAKGKGEFYRHAGRWLKGFDEGGGSEDEVKRTAALWHEVGFKAGQGVGSPELTNSGAGVSGLGGVDVALAGGYCIGQALDMMGSKDGLYKGAVHPMIADWLEAVANGTAAKAEEEASALDAVTGKAESRMKRGPL